MSTLLTVWLVVLPFIVAMPSYVVAIRQYIVVEADYASVNPDWTVRREREQGQASCLGILFVFMFFVIVAAMLYFVFGINVLQKAGLTAEVVPQTVQQVKYVLEEDVQGQVLYCWGIPIGQCDSVPQQVHVIGLDGSNTLEYHVDWVTAWVDYREGYTSQSYIWGDMCQADWLSDYGFEKAVCVRDLQAATRQAHEWLKAQTTPDYKTADMTPSVLAVLLYWLYRVLSWLLCKASRACEYIWAVTLGNKDPNQHQSLARLAFGLLCEAEEYDRLANEMRARKHEVNGHIWAADLDEDGDTILCGKCGLESVYWHDIACGENLGDPDADPEPHSCPHGWMHGCDICEAIEYGGDLWATEKGEIVGGERPDDWMCHLDKNMCADGWRYACMCCGAGDHPTERCNTHDGHPTDAEIAEMDKTCSLCGENRPGYVYQGMCGACERKQEDAF
jgi:hypothetical protein